MVVFRGAVILLLADANRLARDGPSRPRRQRLAAVVVRRQPAAGRPAPDHDGRDMPRHVDGPRAGDGVGQPEVVAEDGGDHVDCDDEDYDGADDLRRTTYD